MIERHSPKRRNLLAETRLLGEYLAARYPGAVWHLKMRVGPIRQTTGADLTDPGEVALARKFNRWADAVVITPVEVVIIEAKMWDPGNALGKVLEYLKLARQTPELVPYLDRPFVGEVVTGQHDPLAERVIREAGVRYVHYEPDWIEDFYALYPQRRRRAAFSGFEEAGEEEG